MPEDKQLLVNLKVTPDGVELHSKHRHDCVSHTDKDGVYYQNDGGTEGYGSVSNLDKCVNKNLYYGDDHLLVREYFVWGRSYDKDMNLVPFEWIKLKDMDDGHLIAVMDLTYKTISSGGVHKLMVDEWKHRGLNITLSEGGNP